MKTLEIRQERAKLVNDARVMHEKASAEKRDMSAEEKAQFDAMMGTVDALKAKIDAMDSEEVAEDDAANAEDVERQERDERSSRLKSHVNDLGKVASRRVQNVGETRDVSKKGEYRNAYRNWLKTGEYRDILLSTNSSGGYLVAPVEMAQELVQAIANIVAIRDLAHKEEVTSAAALRVPRIINKLGAAEWTGEGACNSADTSLTFGNIDITPTLLAKLAKVSYAMLAVSSNVEGVINQQLTQQFAYAEENAFLNGSGTGQPLGVFTASANGVPTSQDFTTSTAGVLKADDLINARFALKQPYLQSSSARWVMNRSVVAQVRLMKDNYGQYLWQPGIAGNHPDNILDVPVVISEFAPGTIATGAYVAVLGDFEYYTIADYTGGFSIQRLVERFAECSEVGYIGRRFVGGAPVLPEAFIRVKIQ